MGISSIDKNFQVQTKINREGLVFVNVEDMNEFKIHGIRYIDGKYLRMPPENACEIGTGVKYLNNHTAGGRVRFVTDSPYIAIHASLHNIEKMPHFPFTGSSGFDLYRDGIYLGTYVPPIDVSNDFEGVIDVPFGEGEYVINFPLYSGVSSLLIGLKEGTSLKAPSPYRLELPIGFYGSSITQGGCASRPGNNYENIISRVMHVDHINLGFSGNARGEEAMANYISSLNMSAFVCDYDYNAPSNEHLLATHERLYRTVRRAHPELPILLLSRPKYHLEEFEKGRRDIIKSTYEKALSEGDKNVWFISGSELLNEQVRECALVDNCHPNDSGFVSMAYCMMPILKKMLKL